MRQAIVGWRHHTGIRWALRLVAVGLPIVIFWVVAAVSSWKPRVLRAGGSVWSIAWAPAGEQLAIVTEGGGVGLWDTRSGRLAWRRKGGEAGVAFGADGKTLANAGNALQLWDTATGQARFTLPQSAWNTTLDAVAFWPDAKTVAVNSHDQNPLGSHVCQVLLYDATSGRGRGSYRLTVGPEYGIYSTLLSPDGHTIAADVVHWQQRPHEERILTSAVQDRHLVWLWQTRLGQPGAAPVGQAAPVPQTLRYPAFDAGHSLYPVQFSPDGTLLATFGYAHGQAPRVFLWQMPRGKLWRAFPISQPSPVTAAISPDNQMLAVATLDGTTQLWDIATRHLRRSIATGQSNGVNALAFAPDGTTLATGSADATVKLWRVR